MSIAAWTWRIAPKRKPRRNFPDFPIHSFRQCPHAGGYCRFFIAGTDCIRSVPSQATSLARNDARCWLTYSGATGWFASPRR